MPLPPFLEGETYEAILTDLLAYVEQEWPGLDLREGTIVWTILSAVALQLYQVNVNLVSGLERAFPLSNESAPGEFLDLLGEENGLPRLPATAATGTVIFSGTNGTDVPLGTRISTASTTDTPAQVYTVDALVTIAAGVASAAVTAITAGEDGNAGVNTVQLLETPISGITGVNNTTVFSGGAEEESDDDYRDRLLLLIADRSSSGNIAHYREWALSVAGVGAVAVIPLWAGAGTVKVVLLGDDKLPAAAGVVTAVEDYLAEVAPIGADVTVVAATAVNIDIAANITISTGYVLADVEDAIEARLVAHFAEIAFDQLKDGNANDVKYSRIGNLIFETPGIDDYATLTVEAGVVNVAIAEDQVAVLATTVWT
jgi:uncharacterized phage protein gp47/JayE